jgi:hypothetical protein
LGDGPGILAQLSVGYALGKIGLAEIWVQRDGFLKILNSGLMVAVGGKQSAFIKPKICIFFYRFSCGLVFGNGFIFGQGDPRKTKNERRGKQAAKIKFIILYS